MRALSATASSTWLRCTSKIRSHDVGRPSIERERRDQHAAVPDRHELLYAPFRLFLEQLDRVDASGGSVPRGVSSAWNLGTDGFPPRGTLSQREVLDGLDPRDRRGGADRTPGFRLRGAHRIAPLAFGPPVPANTAASRIMGTGGTPSGARIARPGRRAVGDSTESGCGKIRGRRPRLADRCHRL